MNVELTAKSRLVQTFKFLKELNELRNPVPRDISTYAQVMRLDSWPKHPCIAVRRGDRQEEDDTGTGEVEIEPLVRIQRAQLTQCPNPPEVLDGWLEPGWQSVESEVEVLQSRNFPDVEKGSITLEFAADELRAAAQRRWTAAREKWAVAERAAVDARRLFETIHGLWTTMQREGDRMELVLADGMLGVADPLVRHPVLMQRVNLEFDPSRPEFRFNTGTEKVELNRALLRLVPSIEGRMIAQFDKELEEQPVDPLGGVSTEGFFRRLVQGLFKDGEFLEVRARGGATIRPSIWREPVIFVRPRTAGLSTTLDYIVQDLEGQDSKVPEGLSRIVGVETDAAALAPTSGEDGETPQLESGPEPDILFSKPANAEQYEIAARLTKAKAVLVQGPPGTGKTHTIANLLGLLRSDAATLRREAALLRDKRRKLLAVAERLRRRLRDARFSEVDEVVLGGEGLSPIEVAKRVKANADRDGWIPGPLQPGILCPLTEMEVRQLYATQRILTPSDETQLAVSQPVISELVSPAVFRLRATEQARAVSRAQAHRPDLWADGAAAGCASVQLQELHQHLCAATSVLTEEQDWLREVLFAGWMGGDHKGTWEDLLAVADSLAAQAAKATRLEKAHGPELPDSQPISAVEATLGQIIAHLEGGGSLGLMTRLRNRNWHQLIADCRVAGRAPRTPDEFRALRAVAQLEENRNRFAGCWRRAVESLGGPAVESLGRWPERAAQGYAAEIRWRLEWRTTVWERLIGELRDAGFRWDAWLAGHPPVPGDHGELARVQRAGSQGLAEIVEAQAALLRQAELSAALRAQRDYLAGFPQSDAASVLLQSQDSWDVEKYEEAYRELARLKGLRDAYENRQALLTKLKATAPAWANVVHQRQMMHGAGQPPGDSAAAWRWRQWHQELERRAAVSMTELQERLDRTNDGLRQDAARIIEHETWAAQRERTGLREQQALQGFVKTLEKITKTRRGVRDAELLREARRLLTEARRAVPVWIMPLSRVYESFDPRKTKFDVVVIDEASQSDVTALAALYLGREHVVVGDKEQVTPDAIGQQLAGIQRLIATNLQGIPNSHLYDGQTSIYDLAETAFGGVVALREHFRCVPEIIQFSNHLSYNHTIRPLREPFSVTVRPALVAHQVNGFREDRGNTNQVEAEEIASLVIACLNDSAYAVNDLGQPTSFGIISLLGDEQGLRIESQLRRRLPPDVFEKHRLLCGNAAQFQGDERDVVFLSMVDGPPEVGKLPYRDAGPKDLYKKRYNVAVSRARNQLWLVHSLDPDAHLKAEDLRRRLIEHARDPQALMRPIEEQGRRTESVFEKLVLGRLHTAGYRVHPQWPVGSYRIDLIVEGETRRLAVECDGERLHTPEQLHHDLERQAVLERLGWVFVRIRGSVFFRDPDSAMAPVFAKLSHLAIEPRATTPLREGGSTDETVDRIRRRAEAIRREWMQEESSMANQAAM